MKIRITTFLKMIFSTDFILFAVGISGLILTISTSLHV